MPPLSTSNCFDVLEVYSIEDNSTDLTDKMTAQDVQPTPETFPTYPVCLKRWERRLPQKYVVTATSSVNSLIGLSTSLDPRVSHAIISLFVA
jgi:hypothetical protein